MPSDVLMKIEVYGDTDAVTKKASALVAVEARAAVAARGDFVMAASGGHTAWQSLLALAGEDVPRDTVHVVQVDEKVAPSGHPDGNLTHLRESLLEHALLRPERIQAMPAESSNLQATCEEYARTLPTSAKRFVGNWDSLGSSSMTQPMHKTRSTQTLPRQPLRFEF